MNKLKDWVKDFRDLYYSIQVSGKPKIFCVGMNKTGTTSLQKAFLNFGFKVGDQKRAERLLVNYAQGDFKTIIRYCKTAQAFQDFPFSYPETFKYLASEFPDSKFILSIRDDADQWYNSLVKFHMKVYGNGKKPTINDLTNATYAYKGWAWESFKLLLGTDEINDPYDKSKLISIYQNHNKSVIDYFSNSDRLLVINLADARAYQKFSEFLGIEYPGGKFPWENRVH
jgi:hypothetical protein